MVAQICSALPPIGAESPLGVTDVQVWVAAMVDSLGCCLRLPGAQIAAPQVGTLWSRLIVRPVFGLSVGAAAMQYFKLALLAQPVVGSALVAPLQAAPNPPPEVRLAHASIFCPASFEDDPPPLCAAFFFPETHLGALIPGCNDGRPGCNGIVPPIPMPDSAFGDSPPRLPQPLRRSMSSGMDMSEVDMLSETGVGDEAAVVATAASAGLTLPDTSAIAPRLRLDRVQAVIHEQSATLFGELTVYDAIERRLWDEFDERGAIEDTDALRQRDAAAIRCLAALDREIDGAGVAGRELPAPLTESRAKFSRLCELIVSGSASHTGTRLRDCELAHAKAEDELLEARASHQRRVVQSRRRGEPTPATPAEVATARAALARATVLLVSEVRLIATRAALGLVEVIGIEGLARALRVIGRGHGDPLLERLQRHGRWSAAQVELDASEVPDLRGEPTQASEVGVASVVIARQEDEGFLARPEGLAGYMDVRELPHSRRVLSARRHGALVALKLYGDSTSASCQRELRALRALNGHRVLELQGVFTHGTAMYLELQWCAGGSFEAWCRKHMCFEMLDDVEASLQCLAIFRQVWHAVASIHTVGAIHGDLSLSNILLTADHKPVLADLKRCVAGPQSINRQDWIGAPRPTPDYAAPELEEISQSTEILMPTQPGDVYAMGVMMAKAFLGLELEVAGCPYDHARNQRRLPDHRLDVDLEDLLQALLAHNPAARPKASVAAAHRALDPLPFLRRRGLVGVGSSTRSGVTRAEALLAAAEQLREEYRGRRVEEPLMFSRDAVFDAIANSRVGTWAEEALLGEWRVMLNDESGVDGGGLRREVVTLFFEQFEASNLVVRVGTDDTPGAPPTLFIADRQLAEKSPQQWRQMWTAVGAMILRAVVHFGNAPVALSSAVFACGFGRIKRMPPDLDDDVALDGGVAQMMQFREVHGDEWARSELLDWLRRVKRAEPHKDAGYRWMLAQRTIASSPDGGGTSSCGYVLPSEALETFMAMLEQPSYQFLVKSSDAIANGSIVHSGAVLEWTLLWDVYLKYLGGGDRWLAYEAFVEGLTAKGRRQDLWTALTGEQIVEVLEGASLTPSTVVANLEFKPNYGYDVQINSFRRVIESFSEDELSMFLRFATGIGKLPANRRFPAGQKLTIRFMPDQLDHLPSAHTCFWVVDLPPYEEEADMGLKLRQAIAAPQPFAMS